MTTTTSSGPASLFINKDVVLDLSRVILAMWVAPQDGPKVMSLKIYLDGMTSDINLRGEDTCKAFLAALATWHEVRS